MTTREIQIFLRNDETRGKMHHNKDKWSEACVVDQKKVLRVTEVSKVYRVHRV